MSEPHCDNPDGRGNGAMGPARPSPRQTTTGWIKTQGDKARAITWILALAGSILAGAAYIGAYYLEEKHGFVTQETLQEELKPIHEKLDQLVKFHEGE